MPEDAGFAPKSIASAVAGAGCVGVHVVTPSVDGENIIALARAVSEKIFRRASLSKIFEKFFSKSVTCRLSFAVCRLSKFADLHLAFSVSQIFPRARVCA